MNKLFEKYKTLSKKKQFLTIFLLSIVGMAILPDFIVYFLLIVASKHLVKKKWLKVLLITLFVFMSIGAFGMLLDEIDGTPEQKVVNKEKVQKKKDIQEKIVTEEIATSSENVIEESKVETDELQESEPAYVAPISQPILEEETETVYIEQEESTQDEPQEETFEPEPVYEEPQAQQAQEVHSDGSKWYVSSHYSSKFYYCEKGDWQGLSERYLQIYDSESALLASYPYHTLHESCQ